MRRAPRILTIHPGAPFLATFAERLLAGDIVTGIGPTTPPLEFAAATIYVPTRRAARALATEFVQRLAGPAVLMPKIVPLGHMESIETGLMFETGEGPIDGVPDAVSEIDRRLALMELVHAWAKHLAHAITHVEAGEIRTDSSEALLVAQAPAQAWHLAGDLGALIDEMIVEDVKWSSLASLAPDRFDRYWSVTIKFLEIASKYWPDALKERGLVDAATRQRLLIEREIERLTREDENAPVIAIGSTGTNRSTARLLAAIARRTQGAIVLPGLDKTLDENAWTLIAGDAARGIEPAASHPQAALHRLLPVLGVSRDEVREIAAPDAALAGRIELLTEAFRPADTTESWPDYLRNLPAGQLHGALAGITMVVAADEREEALALALRMREVLEQPGATAALVTPDRALARRVRAELARWNIDIDDSGGEKLATAPYGVLARLALACRGEACKPAEWLALLAHPLVHLGLAREQVLHLAALLEIAVLRGIHPHRDRPLEMLAAARLAASDRHAHRAIARIEPAEWDALEDFIRRITSALQPLHAVAAEASLRTHIEAHRSVLSALVDAHAPIRDESFESFELLFSDLAAGAPSDVPFTAHDYAALADIVMREAVVRGPARAHPRLKILGLLEARLISADVMLLAGLDETIWPPQTQTGAFLNRPMRAELGLTPPERRIGQTAHDFVQALGTRQVVISRAAKRGGAPTVPSRFLQRIEALTGESFAACKIEGERLLGVARQIDRPDRVTPVKRPEPTPALDLRPTSLSITEIETLRRDPYSIFARRILKLQPMEDVGAEPGAREAGTQLHGVLADFIEKHRSGDLPFDALEQLRALAQAKLEDLLKDADYRAFQWPRIEAGLSLWLDWEDERRETLADSRVEVSGKQILTLADGSTFTLHGSADRIDILAAGGCEIIDYKTGRVPSEKEIKVGFAPQLPLEAAMAASGAFTALGVLDVRDAMHVKIGTGEVRKIGRKNDLPALATETLDGLVALLNQFRAPDTPYLARPFPQFTSTFSRYDHLARVKEWSAGPGEGGET